MHTQGAVPSAKQDPQVEVGVVSAFPSPGQRSVTPVGIPAPKCPGTCYWLNHQPPQHGKLDKSPLGRLGHNGAREVTLTGASYLF